MSSDPDPTRATPPPAGPDEPRTLGGRYEVGPLVGRGGMADVHMGHDLRLGRTVAIKILRTDLARDSSFLARFRREAQAAAGLSHPSIVGVYDSGEEMVVEPGGAPLPVPYIVMELVAGHTLRELLNERRVLDPDEAARITAAVLSAMEYAHERGLVHRDIKPANVMVTDAGAVKVMDFGIARALADTAATMTQTQAVMGTARYLSPEQAQGLDVDGRSDLYSVGCLLYELLTGRTPFQGDPVSLVYQHLGEAPKAPSTYAATLPRALDAITLHALEKRPEDRYQSAADFRADLNAARADEPVSEAALTTYQRALGLGVGGGAGAAAVARAAEPGATQVVPVGRADEGGDAGPGWASDGYDPPLDRLDATGSPLAGMGRGGATAAGYDEERTDEMPVRERRHRGAGLLLGTLALLAVAGMAWVLFQVLGPGQDRGPEMVVVPSTIGQPEAQARTSIVAAQLVVGRVTEQASDEPVGTVVGQDPPGGEAASGSAVHLVLSSGPDAMAVPPLAGMEEQAARDALRRAGFTAVRASAEKKDDPGTEKGKVISSDPAAGEEVAPDTPIVLTVASGKVKVPDVVGKDQNIAVLLLDEQTLTFDIELQRTAAAEPGTVLEQSVAPGTRVDQGDEVVLTVALEPVQTTTEVIHETVTQPAPPPVEPTTEPDPEPTQPDPTTEPEPTQPDPTTEPDPEPTGPIDPPPTDPTPTEPGPPRPTG